MTQQRRPGDREPGAYPPGSRDRSAVATVPLTDLRGDLLRLVERFLPHESKGIHASFAIEVLGEATYGIDVRDHRCLVSPGTPPDPVATLRAGPVTWTHLISGATDPVEAFLAGDLHVTGDLNLAVRLWTMFRPGPRTTRVVSTLQTDVRGFRIESLVGGVGRPVVMLHGLGASKVSFLPTFDALAGRYEVHALDLPGFGKSDKPLPAGKRYTMPWMAAMVHGYLRRNRLKGAYLVGNSMGGRIGTEVALRYPAAVSGFVGLGPAVAFDEWQRLAPILRHVQSHWLGVAPFPVREEWLANLLRDMFHEPGTVPLLNLEAAAVEVARDLGDRGYRMALLACARHLGGEKANGRNGFWTRLRDLDVPSYWIWGETDRLVHPKYAARVREALPQARVEVWDRIGHVPQFEDPVRTNTAIAGFLAELDARLG